MVFNSYTFLAFFLLILALYYTLPSWHSRKLTLLVASYLFYAAWNPPFVALLWASTIADWYLAKMIHRVDQSTTRRRLLLASLCVNLGLLGYFKYGDFLLQNFTSLLGLFGVAYSPPTWNIILPVGISFYTFQTLSYTLDVFRRRITPADSFLDYSLYVTFFPQLVAGPIVRAEEFLAQCLSSKRFYTDNLGWGLSLLTIGLFQKIVVADALLAPLVEKLYDATTIPTMSAAWAGTLAFSGQIFCDFAGYSTCAIGVARCLGFTLPDNFRAPYAAIGFSDFWRRWHISLSSWLRDYLYIPLGGNRQGLIRTQFNLLLTMLLGGLWHGASWTFVIWGGLHGVYLIAERILRKQWGNHPICRTWFGQISLLALTFTLTSIAWVFFRSASLTQAWQIILSMLGLQPSIQTPVYTIQDLVICITVITGILLGHWIFRHQTLEALRHNTPWWANSLALSILLYAIVTMPGEDRSFIYFQF